MEHVYQTDIGSPNPLGPTIGEDGVNFAIFSAHATKIELCLFNESLVETRVPMEHNTNQVWHVLVKGVKAGQKYGYRVYGPFEPERGFRFNPNKLLLDPYAKAIGRDIVEWTPDLYGYMMGHEAKDLSFDERDSADAAPLGMVVDSTFDWENDAPPRHADSDMVIMEMHVRGFTAQLEHLPMHLRGSYAALGSEECLDYLCRLGITTVELLPVHHHLNDHYLADKGLTNYWGYNTLSFFAIEPNYSVTPQDPQSTMNEFKTMVKRLHQRGIEVILDVVYNHTAEGNELGPTLSFKGIDNMSYYRLSPPNPRYYEDFTGTGNTLSMRHPAGLRLLMDSLRYWVTEMHVDGFRFDLASALARELHGWDQLSTFFNTIAQDPVLSEVKLIAEPWDIGDGGYQVGSFPPRWAEWNGRYRDDIRLFIKGQGRFGQIALRMKGSPDLYNHSARTPQASINFVTCHDGFCLRDLVSYNDKHNDENGEGNRDGANDNNSWNGGVEGETDSPEIVALRMKQAKNFMLSLMVSQGVPMFLSGDERWHTKNGNNNTYCQDNELSWLSWNFSKEAHELQEFIRQLIRVRKALPILRHKTFLPDLQSTDESKDGVIWWNNVGRVMTGEDWDAGFVQCFGMWLVTAERMKTDPMVTAGLTQVCGVLCVFNAHHEALTFVLPEVCEGSRWALGLATDESFVLPASSQERLIHLPSRTSVILFSGS